MRYDDKSPYPHDGKHGRCGCGYGYTWNDDDYVGRGGGSSGGGKGGLIFLITVIVCSVIGVFNELLATLIIIIVGFILFVST